MIDASNTAIIDQGSIERLREAERFACRAAELCARAVADMDRVAELALAADRRALTAIAQRDIMQRERDMAYARTDELANEVQSLRLRLAQDEAATQPPAVA